MQENSYYTPDIQDFFSGYEYEMYNGYQWVPQVFPKPWWEDTGMRGFISLTNSIKDEGVRTLYLTKEQIEIEGWKPKYTNKRRYWFDTNPDFYKTSKLQDYYGYHDYSVILSFDPEDQRVILKVDFDGGKENIDDFDTIFDGQCKSINEFRKTMLQLHTK